MTIIFSFPNSKLCNFIMISEQKTVIFATNYKFVKSNKLTLL